MKTFLKANIASLSASFCDYLVTLILSYLLHFHPLLSSIAGTITGGVINFLIGRYWVFKSADAPALHQGKKYFITWLGNLILNALGVFLLLRWGVSLPVAKVATSIAVAVGYNYPIQKNFVFKNIDPDDEKL